MLLVLFTGPIFAIVILFSIITAILILSALALGISKKLKDRLIGNEWFSKERLLGYTITSFCLLAFFAGLHALLVSLN